MERKPRRRRPRDTKDRILDAAENLFNEKGYSKTSLDDIAKAMGMTRGAIYWNFKNKEDLFGEMCNRVWKPLREMMDKAFSEAMEDPIEFLKECQAGLVRDMTEDTHLRKVSIIILLRCEQTGSTTRIYSQLMEWRKIFQDILRRPLMEAQKRKLLPENLDIEMAVSMLYYTYWGMVRNWLLAPTDYDLVEIGRKQLNALLDMFRTSTHMKQGQK